MLYNNRISLYYDEIKSILFNLPDRVRYFDISFNSQGIATINVKERLEKAADKKAEADKIVEELEKDLGRIAGDENVKINFETGEITVYKDKSTAKLPNEHEMNANEVLFKAVTTKKGSVDIGDLRVVKRLKDDGSTVAMNQEKVGDEDNSEISTAFVFENKTIGKLSIKRAENIINNNLEKLEARFGTQGVEDLRSLVRSGGLPLEELKAVVNKPEDYQLNGKVLEPIEINLNEVQLKGGSTITQDQLKMWQSIEGLPVKDDPANIPKTATDLVKYITENENGVYPESNTSLSFINNKFFTPGSTQKVSAEFISIIENAKPPELGEIFKRLKVSNQDFLLRELAKSGKIDLIVNILKEYKTIDAEGGSDLIKGNLDAILSDTITRQIAKLNGPDVAATILKKCAEAGILKDLPAIEILAISKFLASQGKDPVFTQNEIKQAFETAKKEGSAFIPEKKTTPEPQGLPTLEKLQEMYVGGDPVKQKSYDYASKTLLPMVQTNTKDTIDEVKFFLGIDPTHDLAKTYTPDPKAFLAGLGKDGIQKILSYLRDNPGDGDYMKILKKLLTEWNHPEYLSDKDWDNIVNQDKSTLKGDESLLDSILKGKIELTEGMLNKLLSRDWKEIIKKEFLDAASIEAFQNVYKVNDKILSKIYESFGKYGSENEVKMLLQRLDVKIKEQELLTKCCDIPNPEREKLVSDIKRIQELTVKLGKLQDTLKKVTDTVETDKQNIKTYETSIDSKQISISTEISKLSSELAKIASSQPPKGVDRNTFEKEKTEKMQKISEQIQDLTTKNPVGGEIKKLFDDLKKEFLSIDISKIREQFEKDKQEGKIPANSNINDYISKYIDDKLNGKIAEIKGKITQEFESIKDKPHLKPYAEILTAFNSLIGSYEKLITDKKEELKLSNQKIEMEKEKSEKQASAQSIITAHLPPGTTLQQVTSVVDEVGKINTGEKTKEKLESNIEALYDKKQLVGKTAVHKYEGSTDDGKFNVNIIDSMIQRYNTVESKDKDKYLDNINELFQKMKTDDDDWWSTGKAEDKAALERFISFIRDLNTDNLNKVLEKCPAFFKNLDKLDTATKTDLLKILIDKGVDPKFINEAINSKKDTEAVRNYINQNDISKLDITVKDKFMETLHNNGLGSKDKDAAVKLLLSVDFKDANAQKLLRFLDDKKDDIVKDYINKQNDLKKVPIEVKERFMQILHNDFFNGLNDDINEVVKLFNSVEGKDFSKLMKYVDNGEDNLVRTYISQAKEEELRERVPVDVKLKFAEVLYVDSIYNGLSDDDKKSISKLITSFVNVEPGGGITLNSDSSNNILSLFSKIGVDIKNPNSMASFVKDLDEFQTKQNIKPNIKDIIRTAYLAEDPSKPGIMSQLGLIIFKE